MKKLFLFLVFAVTFNLSAQTISTTYFAKPLELNSVPASTSKADSVVVWSNKILKHVPRSEVTNPQVNSDWNATSGASEILNKPIIPDVSGFADKSYVDSQDFMLQSQINNKQEELISGSNIKTINGNSLLGSENLIINPGTMISDGTSDKLPKFNSSGDNIINSSITDNGTLVTISNPTEINSGVANTSGLKFTNLKNITSGVTGILGTTEANPHGILADSAGNIYTVSYDTRVVNKITPAGVTSTFCTLSNQYPEAIKMDSAGNLYVSHLLGNTVSKVTAAGVVSTLGTTGTNPRGITIDSAGNVYTANTNDNNVTKITPAGASSILGTTGTQPYDITIDSAGNVYTANAGSANVTKITPAGVSSTFGTTGSSPRGITIDSSGNIYTANSGSNNVTKITPAGASSILGTTGNTPYKITIDSGGNVYTTNVISKDVTKITPSGTSSIIGTTGTQPFWIAIDSAGNVFTTNAANANVTKISPPGVTKSLTVNSNGEVVLSDNLGNKAPLSSTDTGKVGEIRVTSGFIYWCVGENSWLRAAGSTF